MYQFTNSFTCASSSDKKTVMIHFRQKSPNITEKGEIEGEKIEAISMVMMDMDTAQALGKALLSAKDGFGESGEDDE